MRDADLSSLWHAVCPLVKGEIPGHIIGGCRKEAHSESLQSGSSRGVPEGSSNGFTLDVTLEELFPKVQPHWPSMAPKRDEDIRGRKTRGQEAMRLYKAIRVSERQK